MTVTTPIDPAAAAANEAISKIRDCIDLGKSFCLEAGAGSGKTHSLVSALTHIVEKRGRELVRKHQQVACISYTNAASKIISARTDEHPAVFASTIHSFCWSLIKDYQPYLRAELSNAPNWTERLTTIGGIGNRSVEYNLGHPVANKEEASVSLGHGDVLKLATKLLGNSKFRRLLASKHPIIFIDEYQDTDIDFIEAIKTHILEKSSGLVFGFFGDPWQRIYGRSCGAFDSSKIVSIQQGANFRSRPKIVETLNRIRPSLPQSVRPHEERGSVSAYHTNDWAGERQTGAQWKGDLPPNIARDHIRAMRSNLEAQGWDFSPKRTKILMLTHNVLAQEQGYSGIAQVFKGRNDDYASKEDDHIKFLVEVIEPACRAYEKKQYGDMFSALESTMPTVRSPSDKQSWTKDMDMLIALRTTATIGAVLDHIAATKRPPLPDVLEGKEREFKNTQVADDEATSWMTRLRALRQVPYREIVALANFLDASTLYSTKHGVKGDEFENVLVVVGRGWNLYDFNELLELSSSPNSINPKRADAYERNRNLLYVALSRAKVRLAVLFTQKLSNQATETLSSWFGGENVYSLKLQGT
ncbi:DNA helicase II [Corallococcus coralloides DSM 2259]|uniref:DNA 3'-5' helicase II n=1 Tax=Corallococcus coralloides (strain ATCC 25202 / DSM 2259 / NBRC 100086 / M2) TaxID=1144275 RepID=H8MWD8_CORCM|nr:UvrD-helicase domain-containing protein [Corallococcus coralloides]AFE07796.1 DNA helicase II [Corallococcus coralloides DSM 2259]